MPENKGFPRIFPVKMYTKKDPVLEFFTLLFTRSFSHFFSLIFVGQDKHFCPRWIKWIAVRYIFSLVFYNVTPCLKIAMSWKPAASLHTFVPLATSTT